MPDTVWRPGAIDWIAHRPGVELNMTTKRKTSDFCQWSAVLIDQYLVQSSSEASSGNRWEPLQRPTARHAQRKLKLGVSIGSLSSAVWEPCGRGWKDCKSRGVEDTSRTWPAESTKQGSNGPAETEAARMGPAWVCTRSSSSMFWLLAWWFGGLLTVGVGLFLALWACSWDSSSY